MAASRMSSRSGPGWARIRVALLPLLLLAPSQTALAALVPTSGLWRSVAAPPLTVALRSVASPTATTLRDGTVLIHELRYTPATDTWRTLALPATLGAGATQTLLPDGRVLFAGEDSFLTATTQGNTAFLYDPGTDAWAATTPLPESRVGHTATALADGTVLLVGGDVAPATAIRYDPATDRWTPTGPLRAGRQGHTATLLPDGRVLVAGGQASDGSALASAELYDPATNAWADAAPLQHARYAHTATRLGDGTVLVVGGRAMDGATHVTERYDPITGTWRGVAGLDDGRYGHAAVLLADGTVLVAGGFIGGQPSAGAARYDPTTGETPATFGVRAKAGAPALAALPDGTALLAHGAYTDRFDPAAPPPAFRDVIVNGKGYEAITNLAARGIVRGYGDGTFGRDEPVLRAQVAAMVMRGMAWETETYANPFPDRGPVDAELWRAVATLAHYRVAQGYADGTYDPTGPVLKIQVVSLVTRAQLARGYWTALPYDSTPYPNVPESSGARADLVQFVAHAGPVPGTSETITGFAWDEPADRAWTAEVLWQAFSGGASR